MKTKYITTTINDVRVVLPNNTNNGRRNHGLPTKRNCGFHKTKRLANRERLFAAFDKISATSNNGIVDTNKFFQAIFDFMNNEPSKY